MSAHHSVSNLDISVESSVWHGMAWNGMAEIKAAISAPSFLPLHLGGPAMLCSAGRGSRANLSPKRKRRRIHQRRQIPPESVDILPSLRCFVFVSSPLVPLRRRIVLGDSERDASFRGKSNGLSIPLFSSLPFPVDYWKNA